QVSSTGLVAGSSLAQNGRSHAFLYDTSLGMLDLGTLPGFEDGYAYGVNGAGVVVGAASREGQNGVEQHAFRYRPGGGIEDLTDPIDTDAMVPLTAALGINDAGAILAYGTLDGASSYFVLEPPDDPQPQ